MRKSSTFNRREFKVRNDGGKRQVLSKARETVRRGGGGDSKETRPPVVGEYQDNGFAAGRCPVRGGHRNVTCFVRLSVQIIHAVSDDRSTGTHSSWNTC